MTDNTERLVTVVLPVSDLDRAVKLYGGGFGLDLHVDDHHGDDPWTSGRHAATSWSDGAFMHFALYETKDGAATSGAQIAFRVADLDAAHERAVDAAPRSFMSRSRSCGDGQRVTATSMATSSN